MAEEILRQCGNARVERGVVSNACRGGDRSSAFNASSFSFSFRHCCRRAGRARRGCAHTAKRRSLNTWHDVHFMDLFILDSQVPEAPHFSNYSLVANSQNVKEACAAASDDDERELSPGQRGHDAVAAHARRPRRGRLHQWSNGGRARPPGLGRSSSRPPAVAAWLARAAYDASELRRAGFTPVELLAAGYSPTVLKEAKFSIRELHGLLAQTTPHRRRPVRGRLLAGRAAGGGCVGHRAA